MNIKNICKFTTGMADDTIEAHSFVFETNPKVMKTQEVLRSNRAILIKKGSVNFTISGTELFVGVGTLIFAFSGESICGEPHEECEYMYIDFDGGRAERLFRKFNVNEKNRVFFNVDGIIPIWYESLANASEENTELATESMLLYAFSRLKIDLKKDDIIQKIIYITERSFSNSKLSLSLIAEELSYNEKYLSHRFKEKMGVCYNEYLRTYRIKYAVALFNQGIASVTDTAHMTGYADPMYFSKVFKQCVGVAPMQYIKSCKK